jgi:hypothetical protein
MYRQLTPAWQNGTPQFCILPLETRSLPQSARDDRVQSDALLCAAFFRSFTIIF